FTVAEDVIQRYDGTITQVTGDGFLAMFGAPVAQEDHARRAVLAALELQQRVRQHPTLGTPALGEGLALSMGVHSGRVVVGRQRELALLHDRLEAVRMGAGQVVSLVGPPGMGKTRLLMEFGRSVPLDQVTWYSGQCLTYGQTTPYLPVREILQQVCAIAAGDS